MQLICSLCQKTIDKNPGRGILNSICEPCRSGLAIEFAAGCESKPNKLFLLSATVQQLGLASFKLSQ